jgi:hypothetical protein
MSKLYLFAAASALALGLSSGAMARSTLTDGQMDQLTAGKAIAVLQIDELSAQGPHLALVKVNDLTVFTQTIPGYYYYPSVNTAVIAGTFVSVSK